MIFFSASLQLLPLLPGFGLIKPTKGKLWRGGWSIHRHRPLKTNAPTDSEKSPLQDNLFSGVVAVCTCLGQGMNLLPLREGLPSHFVLFAQPRLICKHRHHATRVQIVAGPNELRVTHFFPHIIRFLTLFRRHRCTPNEY